MADLTALRAIPTERARLDARELALIDQARRAGATWAEVAEALGLSSRQAAEQRRLRLTAAVHPVAAELDLGLGTEVAALRTAAAELHRRIGADRRWDRRFTRAALVRQTLAAAPEAPVSALYALVADAVADLSTAGAPLPAPTPPTPTPTPPAPAPTPPVPTPPAPTLPAPTLPAPTRAAVARLISALEAATPRP